MSIENDITAWSGNGEPSHPEQSPTLDGPGPQPWLPESGNQDEPDPGPAAPDTASEDSQPRPRRPWDPPEQQDHK